MEQALNPIKIWEDIPIALVLYLADRRSLLLFIGFIAE